MAEKTKKSGSGDRPDSGARGADRGEFSGAPSATAVAAEALRTGVVPLTPGIRQEEVPGHDRDRSKGNSEARAARDASGEESATGHMPSPEHNDVDAIGRSMGVQEEDSGGLRTSSELLDARDRKRAQQDGPE